jgi:hypothetical protein
LELTKPLGLKSANAILTLQMSGEIGLTLSCKSEGVIYLRNRRKAARIYVSGFTCRLDGVGDCVQCFVEAARVLSHFLWKGLL